MSEANNMAVYVGFLIIEYGLFEAILTRPGCNQKYGEVVQINWSLLPYFLLFLCIFFFFFLYNGRNGVLA